MWIYIIFSILDGCSAPAICWCVPTKRVSQGFKQGRKPYSESESVFFRIHANQKKIKFFCQQIRLELLVYTRCFQFLNGIWFLFCYRIFSLKTVICCTNSSSHEQLFIGAVTIDWCCFYYFLRNSLVALLEALFARIFFRFEISVCWIFFFFARPVSYKTPSSAPPDQAPVPGCRHSFCVLIIHVCLCVRAYICACENV